MGPTWLRPGNSSEGPRAPGLGHREAGGLTVTELGSVPLPGSLCSLSRAGRRDASPASSSPWSSSSAFCLFQGILLGGAC